VSAAADPRAARAAALLAGEGIAADVSVEGHEGEIAAVRVAAGELARMLGDDGVRLAREVKRLGFRYVAVDLRAAGEGDAAPA
jgi:hypothetical protein